MREWVGRLRQLTLLSEDFLEYFNTNADGSDRSNDDPMSEELYNGLC